MHAPEVYFRNNVVNSSMQQEQTLRENWGEEHDPETHLIPLAISAAAGKVLYLEIYGNDYETADGTAVRDYVHVTDLADAHLAALQYLNSGGPSAAFNLGTGSGHSVRDVVTIVEQVTGCIVPFREVMRRPGDPPRLVADATRAKTVLGWHAQCSTLEQCPDGLELAGPI